MIETPETGRVTIDDVRKMLATAAQDPRKTNAGAVRRVIGRGSLGTIQKHLEALRAELEPKSPVLDGETPKAPADLTDALWRAAWTAAQASTAQALASALLERDAARTLAAATAADLDALTADAEADAAAAVAAEAVAKSAQDALEALKAETDAAASKFENKLSQALTNAESLVSGLDAAHKLDKAHSETKIATLQGVIDRLSEQLAEVKSLLPRVVTAS
jgi:hypothetical protein